MKEMACRHQCAGSPKTLWAISIILADSGGSAPVLGDIGYAQDIHGQGADNSEWL